MSSQEGTVASRLTALMGERDMRAEELAFRLHVSHRTVTRWVAGSHAPAPTMARRLGEFFEVDWRIFTDQVAA